MIGNSLKYCLVIVVVTITACTPKPKINVTDNLETGLGKRYKDYIMKLNNSFDGDTIALQNFFMIDNLYDGASYDHGWVLIELLKQLGDSTFAKTLNKMNKKQLNNLKMYFMAGLDIHRMDEEIANKYPKSIHILGLALNKKGLIGRLRCGGNESLMLYCYTVK